MTVNVSSLSNEGARAELATTLYSAAPMCSIPLGWLLPSSEIPGIWRNQWSHALTCFNNAERKTM